MPHGAPQEVVLSTKNSASLVMGIAAIAVSVLALLFGWVPFLGLLAIPVAILGLVLAGTGLLIAMFRQFKGAALPSLGILFSLAGVAVPLLSTGGTSVAISENVRDVSSRIDAARSVAGQARALRESQASRSQQSEAHRRASYISDHVALYDVEATYMDSLLDGKVPGVLFKLKNNGDQILEMVEVTVYFKDASGAVIAEEDFRPVNAGAFSLSSDSGPLKPGYIWQLEKGKFYSAKSVPSEWKEASVDAKITDIRFAAAQSGVSGGSGIDQ